MELTLIIIAALIWTIASCLLGVFLLVRATCPLPPRQAGPSAPRSGS